MNIVSLESWPNKPCTAFLLVDAETGNLFHGMLQADVKTWLEQYLQAGINVTDFCVGNQPILPVSDIYLYPKFAEGNGRWTRYEPSPYSILQRKVEVKRPRILQRREFSIHSAAVASRLRNEIAICERIRIMPSPYLAEYKGVEVDIWGRVTGIAYSRYKSNLLDFVEYGYLQPRHIHDIRWSVFKALCHLGRVGIYYGIVSPENVWLNYVGDGREIILGSVVLGGFEQAVIGDRRRKVVKMEEAVVDVEQDVDQLRQVIKKTEEEVWEVKCELREDIDMESVERLESWMWRMILGF